MSSKKKAESQKRKKQSRRKSSRTMVWISCIFAISACAFLASRFFLNSTSSQLSLENQRLQNEIATLDDNITALENEVASLSDRTRIVNQLASLGYKIRADETFVYGPETEQLP